MHSIRAREAIDKATEYIKENYHREDISLEEVGSQVCLAYYYFSHLFKRELNITFVDYLNRVRLAHAVELLKNLRLHVKQVAFATGFQDPLYFSKVFKKYMRVSPVDFRREYFLKEKTGQEIILVERRKFSRVHVSFRVLCKVTDKSGKIVSPEEIITYTKDLNERGMLLEWPSPTPAPFLEVELNMPIIPNPLKSKARMIWTKKPDDPLRNDRCDVGMAFGGDEGDISQEVATLKSRIFL